MGLSWIDARGLAGKGPSLQDPSSGIASLSNVKAKLEDSTCFSFPTAHLRGRKKVSIDLRYHLCPLGGSDFKRQKNGFQREGDRSYHGRHTVRR